MADIRVYPDPPAVARAAADTIVQCARDAKAIGHPFSLVLSGGSTPKLLFELLAAEPYRSQIDWPSVEIYFGDERAVPPDHADSNFRMASESLLSRVPLKPENVHRMRGEIDPNEAAIEYGRMLKARFGDGGGGGGGPDVTLLGMGDDGHTASLFPGEPLIDDRSGIAAAVRVEKLQQWRITLLPGVLLNARHTAMLVTGADKALALRSVLHEPWNPRAYPAQLASGERTAWFLDSAAANQAE